MSLATKPLEKKKEKCQALVKDTSNSNNTLKCVQLMFEK
jgi:hypothetical protein